jgi:GNAT superfamily N-acetyltransferase
MRTPDVTEIEIYDEDGELSVNLDDGSYAVVWYGSRKQVLARLLQAEGERDASVRETERAFRRAPPRAKVAYLASIELTEEARGRGLGTRVVQRLLEACRTRGVKLVVLHALRSAGFWRRLGFVELAPEDRELDFMPGMMRQLGAVLTRTLGGQGLGAATWDPAYGQSPAYARDYARARVPVRQIASPFMNPVSQARVDELAELEDAGYDLPPVIVDGPGEVEEVDYPEEKYPFLDGHYPEVGEDVWYVHDGHHRVMLAIQQGRRFVDALVMG